MTVSTAPTSRRALTGTRTWSRWTSECRLVVTDVTTANRAYELANDLMDRIETAIDRFNPGSELSQLAAGDNEVSMLLSRFLETALQAAWKTEGLLDPTVGSSSWRDIAVTGTDVSLPSGTQLDLGSTGKAAAADLIAARIRQSLGTGVLVSLGGDISTAGGPTSGWQVDVQDSEHDPAATVSLTPGAAIATSSTLHRRRTCGESVSGHHIIDPRTGRSAEGPWRTVTVVAPSCVEANTASTAAIIHGPNAVSWLSGLGLPARLVAHDGTVTAVNGFPERDAR